MGLGIGGCSLSPPFSLTEKQFKAQRRGDSSLSPETAFKSTLHMLLLQLSASHQHDDPPVPARKPSTPPPPPAAKRRCQFHVEPAEACLPVVRLGAHFQYACFKKNSCKGGAKKGKIIFLIQSSIIPRQGGILEDSEEAWGGCMNHQLPLTAPRWSLYWSGLEGMSARFPVNIYGFDS